MHRSFGWSKSLWWNCAKKWRMHSFHPYQAPCPQMLQPFVFDHSKFGTAESALQKISFFLFDWPSRHQGQAADGSSVRDVEGLFFGPMIAVLVKFPPSQMFVLAEPHPCLPSCTPLITWILAFFCFPSFFFCFFFVLIMNNHEPAKNWQFPETTIDRA